MIGLKPEKKKEETLYLGNNLKIKNDMKKVKKANYEIHQFIGGHFGIVEKTTQDCIFGGDSADHDSYDEELMIAVYAQWGGVLNEDGRIEL